METKTHSLPIKLRDGSTIAVLGKQTIARIINKKHYFGCTDNLPVEKEKLTLELSGVLTEDINAYQGVVIKYNEPPEACVPKPRWRLYPFKNDESFPLCTFADRAPVCSADRRELLISPLTTHPVTKQHTVSQYRLIEIMRADGTTGPRVKPYIIDLGSGNGTYLNQGIELQRYYELKDKDFVKFGFSSHQYIFCVSFQTHLRWRPSAKRIKMRVSMSKSFS